jgi:hypothetical protein
MPHGDNELVGTGLTVRLDPDGTELSEHPELKIARIKRIITQT